jgi:hypothetical protein
MYVVNPRVVDSMLHVAEVHMKHLRSPCEFLSWKLHIERYDLL